MGQSSVGARDLRPLSGDRPRRGLRRRARRLAARTRNGRIIVRTRDIASGTASILRVDLEVTVVKGQPRRQGISRRDFATSSANQNPSLTDMALTARACHYAVEQLKRGAL